MNRLPPDTRHQAIVDALAERGWCVVPDFLPAAAVTALADECFALHGAGRFKHAGIGKGQEHQVRQEIRGDDVLWLDEASATPAQRVYLDALEGLRQSINRDLHLGLFEYEGHYALYPPGAFYQRHLDNFRGQSARTVTCVFYLNHNWSEADGGQLRFYTNGESEAEYVDIVPHAGTLACFLTREFYHAVLPARRERSAVTGWFKVRG